MYERVLLPQQIQEIFALVRVSERLPGGAGQFDTVVPLTKFGDAAPGELDHYVHRFATGHVAGEEGADSVGVLHPSGAVAVDFDGLFDVETVAVDDLLGGRVYAERTVFGDDLVRLLEFVSAVHILLERLEKKTLSPKQS